MKVFALLFATLLIPAKQNAQVIAQSSNENRLVTLSMKNVSLREALESVARQSGVPISIGEPALAANVRVNVNTKSVSARDAVNQILVGTGFRVEMSAVGDVLVIKDHNYSKASRGQGIITGKVVDSKTGKGIAGANVSLDNDVRAIITDENGSYRLVGIANGIHTIVVRLVGYAKQARSVTVGENANITIDFKLESSANVLDQVVVTGTVIATELKAVPNAITVITAKQIEERGITRIDQLFRGDIPGLFSLNIGSKSSLDEVTMFSRGATALSSSSAGTANGTNPIKTYIDGIEMADPKYLSQIDPNSIERIEILTGPQASTIYGSNAINGVMQIFTKRGTSNRPQLTINLTDGVAQNNFSSRVAPSHLMDLRATSIEGRWSYNVGGSWEYIGSWTPGKQTQRLSYNGGARSEWPKITADISARQGLTKNKQNGDVSQRFSILESNGIYKLNSPIFFLGIPTPQTQTLNGHTFGLSLGYRPLSWWSHTMVLGSDASTAESAKNAPGFSNMGDTSIFASFTGKYRMSENYNSTVQLSLSSLAKLNLTFGGDHWRTKGLFWQGGAVNGIPFGPALQPSKPDKNSGAFVQGQLSFFDGVFFTYGIRSDWNPNFGDKARVLPGRYGVSITHDMGLVSAKLRGSYGRSIRPPAAGLSLAQRITDPFSTANFGGPFDHRLANPELVPEDQRGGEGGIELYVGNRGSLVVTRYNQTVSNLISDVSYVDSVPTLFPVAPNTNGCGSNALGLVTFDSIGRCFQYQEEYLNVGNIRNQGWELQGSVNVGPFTTRGTYSWTKSRVIGITPKYKALLASDVSLQPGRSFTVLPEHTWALGLTYTQSSSMASLSINGVGMMFGTNSGSGNALVIATSSSNRLTSNRARIQSLTQIYTPIVSGYATADLNAIHKFSSSIDGLLQVTNLTDYYRSDLGLEYATMGRQTKIGMRIRTK